MPLISCRRCVHTLARVERVVAPPVGLPPWAPSTKGPLVRLPGLEGRAFSCLWPVSLVLRLPRPLVPSTLTCMWSFLRLAPSVRHLQSPD